MRILWPWIALRQEKLPPELLESCVLPGRLVPFDLDRISNGALGKRESFSHHER